MEYYNLPRYLGNHPNSQATLRAIACGRSAHEHDPCCAVLRPALDAGRTENLSAEWRHGYFFGGSSSNWWAIHHYILVGFYQKKKKPQKLVKSH